MFFHRPRFAFHPIIWYHSAMETCSVIIASYNDAENLEKCLNSLRQINFPREDLEMIVVDNGSTDNTSKIIRDFPKVVYLREEQQGASYARNRGIQEAQGNILVFLDTDTKVTENWLNNILVNFKDGDIGAVGGAIYSVKRNNLFSRYLGVSLFMRYPRYGKRRTIKGFPSCNLAVRKELAEDGFDTRTFSTYGEDKDLCWRIIQKGYKIIFDPEAIIFHRHAETLQELFHLIVKSSAGRASFGKKYPFAPDIVLLNFHLPLFYSAALIVTLVTSNQRAFLLLLLPSLLYMGFNSIVSYRRSRDPILSFLIKPVFDIASVFLIYVSYHWNKWTRDVPRRHCEKH